MEFFVQNIFKNILSRLESPQLVNYPSSSLPPPLRTFQNTDINTIWEESEASEASLI